MSEKIYALLLRLYPAHFRAKYGDEAMLLFRDRARAERGLLRAARLWFDLLSDWVVSFPRVYRCGQTELAGAQTDPVMSYAPAFYVFEKGTPRLGTQFCAGLLSLLAFFVVLIAIGHGGSTLPLNSWVGEPAAPVKIGHDPVSQQPAAREHGAILDGANGIALSKGAQAAGTQTAAGGDRRVVELAPADEMSSSLNLKLVLPARNSIAGQAHVAEPDPEDATRAMIEAFQTHEIVMFGETHGNRQEYEWLCRLVSRPEFADRVDDIVVEFGNSLYQKSVDRYIAGDDVPLEQVQKAWRNMIGAVGPPSLVYEQFYESVRAANMSRRGKHQMRMVLGDPYGDWEKIRTTEDLGPYVAHRDEWYAQVVKDEVLAKHHRALLIMGAGHFLRKNGPGVVESAIRASGVVPYLVIFGTNVTGDYEDLDPRFNTWPRPAIAAIAGNWLGDLPANSVATGGMVPATSLTLGKAADALLYAGPRDTLTQLRMPRAELDGSAYGNEMARRILIQTRHSLNFLYDETEVAQYAPRAMRVAPAMGQAQTGQSGSGGHPGGPPMPKSMNDPLPPRPPSQ